MNRRTLTRRIVTLIMMLAILASLASNASAAYSAIHFNIAPQPCQSNLSSTALPASGNPVQGDTYYLNLATTTDFQLDSAEFYVKTPGQSSFQYYYRYDPNGYFRWVNCAYTFTSAGTYEFRVSITTTQGATGGGSISVDVAKRTDQPQTSSDSGDISISWSPSDTSTTRKAKHLFSINGHSIVPGTIHNTYYSNGKKSTAGDAQYCYYNNKLTYVAGAQCLNYAYYCQLLLYGTDSHTTTVYNTEKDDGKSEFYGVRYNRKLTADEYRNLLAYTGPGTHLRCRYKSSNSHSIFVLKVTDSGFYYTDANTSISTYGRNNIKLGYTTFDDFADGNYSYLSYVEYYHG